jgi:glutathione S-transferase
MILIGMFDSPFARRVAITMKLLAIPFEHRTAGCVFTFLCDALGAGTAAAYPGLAGLTERCERLPEFRAAKLAFAAPRQPN